MKVYRNHNNVYRFLFPFVLRHFHINCYEKKSRLKRCILEVVILERDMNLRIFSVCNLILLLVFFLLLLQLISFYFYCIMNINIITITIITTIIILIIIIIANIFVAIVIIIIIVTLIRLIKVHCDDVKNVRLSFSSFSFSCNSIFLHHKTIHILFA